MKKIVQALFLTITIIANSQNFIKNQDSIADNAHDLSIKYYRANNYKHAIINAQKEVAIRRQLINKSEYKNSLFNLGLFYFKNKQYYQSITTYNIVIDSFDIDKKTYQSYCNIGRSYYELEDYYKSKEYFEIGLSRPKYLNGKSNFRHSLNYAITLDFIENKASLNKEFKLLQRADSLSTTFKLSTNDFYQLYFTYANYFKNDLTFDFIKSKQYYTKVLEKAESIKDTATIISTFNNISSLFKKIQNDSAEFYLKRGIELSKKSNPTLPKLYNHLSEYYYEKEQIEDALITSHNALQLIIAQELDSTYTSVPSTKQLSLSSNKGLCLIILKNKGIYLFKKYTITKNIEYAKHALDNFLVADKIIDQIKGQSIEKKSKLLWQNEASEIYMQAVSTCFILNKPEDAYYYMEKNKALLLLENISENQLRKQANIPISILEEELELKQHILSIENSLRNKNPLVKDSLQSAYYSSKIDLSNFVQSLEKEHPLYYNFKKPLLIVPIQNVKEKLEEDTLILEYILNDVEGFVLAISKNKTSLYKLEDVPKLSTKIDIYLSLISQPITTNKLQNEYQNIASSLYKSLIPLSMDNANIIKLKIIPDSKLQNLPFESLLLSKKNNDYLINNYEVSYTYSLSFSESNMGQTKKVKNNFIGFAPKNFSYNNLSSLKNSIQEVNAINNHFSGQLFTESHATKSNFISNAGNYNIIHLATHANANDSLAPWIAFSDQQLYLNELYTFKNQANLVVLSACNTSLGKINPGEGVFSLARGFFHGGSKSVVSSLWNVNDKATQEIISSFYANLEEGQTKSKALRLAKLDYINSHQLSEQSPYYWSSFILMGDAGTIPINNNSFYFPLLLIILLVLFSFILFKK